MRNRENREEQNTKTLGWESHGNGSFLFSPVLVGGSRQSQGKAVNVQFRTGYIL